MRVGTFVLFLILKEKLSVFYHWIWCWLWLVWPLLCWIKFPLYPPWRGLLSWKYVIFCQILFLHILKWSYNFYLFFFFGVPIVVLKSIWSLCVILLVCYWIHLGIISWGFLHLCSSWILVCRVFFFSLLCVYFALVSGECWPHRMSLRVCSVMAR